MACQHLREHRRGGSPRLPSSFFQVLAPWLQTRAQALPVDLRKKFFRALNVAQSTLQHGTGAHQIASGLMMKRHRQLNQSLEMAPAVAVAGSLAPHVFESLVGVEEVPGVKEG